MLRIRSPEKDDTQLFRLIITRLIPYARKARQDVVFKRSEILRRWKSCRVYVAEGAGHRITGFISCKVEGRALVIDMLAVGRQAEGRGIGSALMAAAETYGRKRGADSVRLAVDEPNTHARRFYMSRGFTAEAYLEQHRMYIMSKRL